MIEKFTVRVEDAVLDDLKTRLARTRWPDQMDGVGWDYGSELGAVRELCEYWRDKFDWRRVEAELCRYEHGTTQIDAEIELMKRLGYARYGAQGGDWGAMISTQIGRLDPAHCAGIHLNMAIAFPAPDAPALTELEQKWVADFAAFQAGETGYQQIQGTKPQTLGYGLTDSPAGLCAWIVEKFRTWSDCGGNLESVYTKDELLANVTLYWVTKTINSSMRLYYETMKSGRVGVTQGRVEVPTALAIFPKEIYKPPRAWAEKSYDVKQFTVFEKGGHFAAMEQPKALLEDVRRFFGGLRA